MSITRFGAASTAAVLPTSDVTLRLPPSAVTQAFPDNPLNNFRLAVFTDEGGRAIKRSRIEDDGVDVSILGGHFIAPSIKTSDITPQPGTSVVNIDGDVWMDGGLFTQSIASIPGSGTNEVSIDSNVSIDGDLEVTEEMKSATVQTITVHAPDLTLLYINNPPGIEITGPVNIKSSNVTLGATTASNYVLPSSRGTQGQILTAAAGDATQWATINTLPVAIATGANQTLLSTNTTGGLAWTAVVSLRAQKTVESTPPTGTQIVITTTGSNILSSIGLNSFNPTGPVANIPAGITYTGPFARTYFISISFDVVTDNKDSPTIEFYLQLLTPQSILARKFVELKNGVFRNIDLAAVGVLSSGQIIELGAVSSIANHTCRIHNPTVNFFMM